MENNSGNPIFVLGQEFLLDLAKFMESSIGRYLQEKWGDNWFDQCVLGEGNQAPEQISDLSFLLKQILDLNNQNFRVAFAVSSFGVLRMEKPHLAALEQIRKYRNLWAHPNRVIKFHDLNRLAFNIQAIVPKTEPLAKKCAMFLQTEENQDQLTKIASLTEINQLYRNQSEYRSEIGRSLKSFADRIEKFDSNEEVMSIYTAQNHLLKNLWMNWLRQQAIFYSLLWDQLLEKRNPRTGARLLSDSQLLELRREIDTEGSFREFEEFAKQLENEIGTKHCACEFCKSLGDQGPMFFKEDSHKKLEQISLAIDQGKEFKSLLKDQNSGGLRPRQILLISLICATRKEVSISKDEVWDDWSYDILNPLLGLDSEVYDDDEILLAAVKLVAIRNGLDPVEVNSWTLD